MGRFARLFSGAGGPGDDDLDSCPHCAGPLTGFGCTSCNVEFVMRDGKLVEDFAKTMGSGSEDESCEMCQASLTGADRYLPYEDGSNPNAYVKCPWCGHQNIRYGLGGDD